MPLVTKIFNYTGATQTFTTPKFVSEIIIQSWGAGAGGGGGPGGYATGRINTVTGDNFDIIVGRGGRTSQTTVTFGGGGPTTANASDPTIVGSSGGGASYLYKNVTDLLLVAGGGGGGGSAGGFSYGGSGGGTTGTNAPNISTTNTGGQGGTQSAGGAGGVNANNTAFNGTAGISFRGGTGGGTNGSNAGTGGGGGGGYFGGGGGTGQQSLPTPGQQETAGGGGSSYIGGVLSGSTLSTPQNTTGAAASFLPPNTSDLNYISPAGTGKAAAAFGVISIGGDGLVVLSYTIPDLILNKIVSKNYSDINNTITYTIEVRNTGPVSVTNIQFVDTIPNGTTFEAGSLTIDSTPSPNNPNPPGFTIASLGPNITTTISYSVKIGATIPTPNPILNVASAAYTDSTSYSSNTVSTQVNHVDIVTSKTVNKSYANISDTLVYTIVLRNTGNVIATNIVFIDTIPNDTTLVSNTFKQDSTNITGSPNPPGVTLPNSLAPGATTTVTFNVKVNTIPNPNPIPNNASSQYSYLVDPTLNTTAIGSGNTNTVLTTVNNANLGNIYKSVDKGYATCGDILTYTITIPNGGNVAAFNVVLRDTIPNGTSLVANSVTVNSVTQPSGTNPQTGVTVGTIAGGSIATVTFQVKVNC